MKMSEGKKTLIPTNKDNLKILIVLIVIGIITFFFIGQNRGYVLYKDSDAFLNTGFKEAYNVGMMPGYCLFVEIIRKVFGEKNYLDVLAFLQGLLAIVVLIRFSLFIKEEYKLNIPETILIFVLSTLPYWYSMPEEIATHAIMTESVSFSVMYIYIYYMLKEIYHSSYKNMIFAVVSAVIMTLIRKQLVLFLLLGIMVIAYMLMRRIIKNKRVFFIILLSVVISCIVGLFSAYLYLYPQKSSMTFDQITYSLAGKAIYMSKPEDSEHYSNKDSRAVFELLYEYADQGEMLYSYADSDDQMKWQHAIKGMNYTTRTVWKNVITYCRENGYADDKTMYLIKEVVCTQIKNEPYGFLLVTWMPIGQSLISSIFIKPDSIYYLCAVLCAVIYLLSLFISYFSYKYDRTDRRAFKTYAFIMFMLLTNAVALNMVFQSLQRYVVYTFGLFYVATVINILTIVRSRNLTNN